MVRSGFPESRSVEGQSVAQSIQVFLLVELEVEAKSYIRYHWCTLDIIYIRVIILNSIIEKHNDSFTF